MKRERRGGESRIGREGKGREEKEGKGGRRRKGKGGRGGEGLWTSASLNFSEACVRPILEYCSPVWSPHLKYLINKIESAQKDPRAAKKGRGRERERGRKGRGK